MFRRPVLLCAVVFLGNTTPSVAQMSQEQQRVLDPLLDAYKQCVFPAATKLARLSNEPADVIRQAALASCSRQHDALAEGFKRLTQNATGVTGVIQHLDTFVDGQILRAILSTRVKKLDEDADAAYRTGDFPTALKLFRPLAEGGDPIAETRLGQMYFSGNGVPEDFTEAAKWLTLGANQGDEVAQASLGVMYFLGRGVPKDFVLSYMWSSLAAEQGFQAAEKSREMTGSLMTPDQIADAQKRARDWKQNRSSMTK